MSINFDRIRIVLVNTSHPGNIGAAARAMKTMGLERLYLVNPEKFPSAQATARASGAIGVLANAQVCNSLTTAVADCQLVIGTSARQRELAQKILQPVECAKLFQVYADTYEVALVFGCERFGLTNAELDLCHYQVMIPTNPNFSSLNLAAAVQILCYELRRQLQTDDQPTVSAAKNQEALATAADLAGLQQHLTAMLTDIKLIRPEKPKRMLLRRLQNLLLRSELTVTEVNILRGICKAVQQVADNAS